MKLLLISPGLLNDNGEPVRVARDIMPGMTLPWLAGLIPARHEIRIINDSVEGVNFDEPADAVLLTGMTSRAERAYQIAAGFRERGVTVVMGGIHATLFPDEVGARVDTVAVGEAEGLIEELIEDLESGRAKPRYEAERRMDLSGLPPPRYDLIKKNLYLVQTDPIHVMRGCPHRCRYCSVHLLYGPKIRLRPIPEVLRDVARAGRFLAFIDDNLMADHEYALELFRALKPMRKIWGMQADISIGTDPELMAAAKQAGCVMLYFGLETLDQECLLSMNKRVNARTDMGQALTTLRRAGIGVMASCMVGFDQDTPESMDELLAFLEKHRVAALSLHPDPVAPDRIAPGPSGAGTAPRTSLAVHGRHARGLPTQIHVPRRAGTTVLAHL
jgi:radical SAM superfamily enzyme YgiQ (UPF0313 family)